MTITLLRWARWPVFLLVLRALVGCSRVEPAPTGSITGQMAPVAAVGCLVGGVAIGGGTEYQAKVAPLTGAFFLAVPSGIYQLKFTTTSPSGAPPTVSALGNGHGRGRHDGDTRDSTHHPRRHRTWTTLLDPRRKAVHGPGFHQGIRRGQVFQPVGPERGIQPCFRREGGRAGVTRANRARAVVCGGGHLPAGRPGAGHGLWRIHHLLDQSAGNHNFRGSGEGQIVPRLSGFCPFT